MHGYKVIVVNDGFAALKIYERIGRQIALVILDFFLPIMDGDAVFDELRSLNPDINVVLSSGFAEQSKISAMLTQGLRGFIPKPYTSEKLIAQVRSILDAGRQVSSGYRSSGIISSKGNLMARIDAFFKLMSEQKASDLHLATGNPPMLRINGELVRVDFPALKNDELKAMVYEIAPEGKIKTFEETSDVDFGYEVPGVARYRANFFQQKSGISAVFRLIPSTILTVEQLGLPPVLKKFPLLKKGLVLVTGPTGSGKSTTLAAMMDYANLQRQDHIITVEDPIEFVHRSQNCLVQHREVGVHTRSFRGRSARGVARRPGYPARRRITRS